jgi:hypothetical protein
LTDERGDLPRSDPAAAEVADQARLIALPDSEGRVAERKGFADETDFLNLPATQVEVEVQLTYDLF